jgi:prepilin-type N-terminal cleavage/methylation domain-containing protein
MLKRHTTIYSRGLTLTELLIVLTLSSILLAIGAPALGQWVRDIEVRSNASSLLAVLHAARTEAVTRNAWVRLQLRDTQGRPGWQLGCLQPTVRCPSLIRQQATDQGTAVRWGAALLSAMPPIHTAIAAGANFPAAIRFDATGAAPNIATGDDIARIDITYNGEPNTRRMVVMVSAQGMVRLCDASVSNTHPMFCN